MKWLVIHFAIKLSFYNKASIPQCNTKKQNISHQLCSDTLYFSYLQRIQNSPPWTPIMFCSQHVHFIHDISTLNQERHTTGRVAAAPGEALSNWNYEILTWSYHLWCSLVQLAASLRPCFNPCEKENMPVIAAPVLKKSRTPTYYEAGGIWWKKALLSKEAWQQKWSNFIKKAKQQPH